MKPIIRIHNLSTNEIIDREMTDEEFAAHTAELQAEAAKLEAKQIEEAEAEQGKGAAKAALLERLGMTAEEAALLLA